MGKLETFKRNRCIAALYKLGFIKKNKRRGKHDKFIPLKNILKAKKVGQPPFIMIPRGRKLYCQNEIVKELFNLGGEDLVKEFEKHL